MAKQRLFIDKGKLLLITIYPVSLQILDLFKKYFKKIYK